MSLVILDRDGVVNHETGEHVKSPEEWIPIEGSLAAIARLNHAGFRVVIATNQSGIARKLYDIETLNRIHDKMVKQLSEVGGAVEAIFFCPHLDRHQCDCRKPKPGMLIDIGNRLGVALGSVPFIGDSPRDIAAARAAGARPMLVLTGNGELTRESLGEDPVEVYDDLSAAVDQIISERSPR